LVYRLQAVFGHNANCWGRASNSHYDSGRCQRPAKAGTPTPECDSARWCTAFRRSSAIMRIAGAGQAMGHSQGEGPAQGTVGGALCAAIFSREPIESLSRRTAPLSQRWTAAENRLSRWTKGNRLSVGRSVSTEQTQKRQSYSEKFRFFHPASRARPVHKPCT
jgi:hypothetical protein